MENNPKLTSWLNWIITTFFVIFQFFLQTAAGIMIGHWKADFQINAFMAANLSAAFFYLYVFMQVPVGLIYDRYNAKLILTLAALCLAFSCFLFSFTHNYYIAFFSRMSMGIGAAFGFVGMLYVTALWFSSRSFPFMVSLAETIGMLSIAIGEILLAWLVVNIGWRYTMEYAGWMALLMAIIILFIVKDKSNVGGARKIYSGLSIWSVLWYLARNKQVWLLGLFAFFNFAIVNVFTSLWGVPFLLQIYHIDLHTAARMMSMVFIGIAAGTLFNSWMSMTLGQRKPVMLISSLIAAFLIIPLISMPKLPHILIYGLLLLTGFCSSSYVLSFSLAKETISPHYRGSALAIVNMVCMIGAPLLQPLVGYLISSHFFHLLTNLNNIYRLALGIIPLGYFISVLLTFFMQESNCKDIYHE